MGGYAKTATGKVTLKINGKSYSAKVKNGKFSVSFKAPSNAKKYSCKLTFSGDSNYKSSSTKFTVTVKKNTIATSKKTTTQSVSKKTNSQSASKTTTTKSVTLAPGAKYTLKVNVKYTNGKKINSGTVKVKVNGKTYTAKVSNGVAKVKITAPSKAGTYSSKATYNGNNQIKSSSCNFKVFVQKYVDIIVKAKFNNYIKETSGKFSVVTYKKIFYSTSEDFAGVYAAVYEDNQEIYSFNRTIQYWAHFTDGSWDYIGNYMNDANNIYSINEISAIDKVKVRIWL